MDEQGRLSVLSPQDKQDILPIEGTVSHSAATLTLPPADAFAYIQAGMMQQDIIHRIAELEKSSQEHKELLKEIEKDLWFLRVIRKGLAFIWKNTFGRIVH